MEGKTMAGILIAVGIAIVAGNLKLYNLVNRQQEKPRKVKRVSFAMIIHG
jgi:hypothetical protein